MDLPRLLHPVVAVVGALGLLTAGCGAASQSSDAPVSLPSVQPATTTTGVSGDVPSADTERPPVAGSLATPVVDPDLTLNRNDPTSALGALCWSQRETMNALMMMITGSMSNPGTDRDLTYEIEMSLARASGVLESRNSELDPMPDVRLYADELLSSVQKARELLTVADDSSIQVSDLADLFDFETYPGFEDFNAMAEQAGECTG